ncbi:anthranilate synthase component I [Synechococcus sp. PCC 7502]|uniref:anthranilate synthase component I n=1 Tax=Synechococcus sp. PCC 7502 TaxID=1173263 RepID=UPI00029FEB36|nr:anthranilate synthase component I [Synechococcus sp. PCC 7502]AFY72648.1 anthranilate synthase component I [Synechococcus sp. PCC 7502]
MTLPSFSDFSQLCQNGNFIPVYQELVADMDTPVAAWYRVCAGQPYSFLLESVEGGERIGRYSLLGCDPLWRLEARGDRTIQTWRDGTTETHIGNPLEHLAACLEPIKPVKLLDFPTGGLIGFWGYELIKWIEPRVPVYACGDHDLPDGLWMQIDSLLVFDQVKRKIWAIAYADLRNHTDPKIAYENACDRVSLLIAKLRSPFNYEQNILNWTNPKTQPPVNFSSNFTAEAFQQGVEKAKEHIKAGDIFQVVLSQRFSTPYSSDPFNLYRSLCIVNPSPYMAYLNFGDWQVIGSSPEVMVKADKIDGKTKATVRPIAGTRPRGQTIAEDLALAEDLLNDPKEVSEHVMLVDLGRNDLGRVCQSGTVVVDELMTIERYSHVMHIVSNVVGELKPDKTAWDLLAACFPAGTVSGAPKIRAMEIIHNLEGDRRGTYAGAYGYYDFEGQLNTAITIRTMIVKDGVLSVQAGAGIVADSDPKMEYQETLNKAKGMLEAIRGLGITPNTPFPP